MELVGGGSLGLVEIPVGEKLYGASLDVSNSFYHLGLPEQLRGLFNLPLVDARGWGLPGLPKGAAWLRPRMKVVPMGWTWALWFAQTVISRAAARIGLEKTKAVREFAPAPQLGTVGGIRVSEAETPGGSR